MKKTGKQNIRWNTMKILAVGFLSVVFLGAVLLWLPVSNEKSISFLDALFTSTSSVCVTGLVTIVPKYQFTITGKVILLILIQNWRIGRDCMYYRIFYASEKKDYGKRESCYSRSL